MLRLLNKIALMVLMLAVVGCRGCALANVPTATSDKASSEAAHACTKLSWNLLADPRAGGGHVSYESTLTTTMSDGTKEQSSVEKISLRGQWPRFHFKKSTDAHHFFEIFQNGTEFFVKDRHGPWHAGDSSQTMYDDIIRNDLNLLQWMIGGFCGEGKIDPIIRFTDQPIPSNSPFLADVTARTRRFSDLADTSLNGVIKVEPTNGMIRSVHLAALVRARDGAQIRVVAEVMLNEKNSGDPLVVPKVSSSEQLDFPVNIKSKFEKIMINGGDSHE